MVRRLQQYEQAFQRNDIDGEVLLELSAEDFDWFRRDLNWPPSKAARQPQRQFGLTKGGLPVGLQIIGSEGEDRTTIEFARPLAAEIGGFAPPPAIHLARPRSAPHRQRSQPLGGYINASDAKSEGR